ncbi:class I SAM-dependent methyltransferase [Amylibacter sp. SFDW26]|uniref:class I SAM-dependent methyltransferase n=1 Tax=Amylibacter sp. SFDW26 TaxID=2652722 RepID=UPI0012625608|nr:class I SAM-dependent methyltransferase [Amylibacter sp. SFDW26]KAB7613618.1 class I SAM-dependent methyltransferase [Amylibacter sp. SFDW26]
MNNHKPSKSLFESTAKYYEKYRLGYSHEVLGFLIRNFNICNTMNIIDLGCGTGHLARPISRAGAKVFAIDPDPEMLCEGLKAEHKEQQAGINWILGSDKTLRSHGFSNIDLCVMGASFHWMERSEVLDQLNSILNESGAIIILSGGFSAWKEGDTNEWNKIVKETIQEFMGVKRRAGRGTYTHPKEKHEDILAKSVFSNITEREFNFITRLSIDQIIGLQLSMSYASPARLGSQLDAFKKALENKLLRLNAEGIFDCSTTYQVIVGKREK